MIIYSKYSIYTLSNVGCEGRSHVCNDEERLRRLRKDLPRSVCFFALFSSAVRAGGESSMHLFWRIMVSWLSHIMFLNFMKLSSRLSQGRHTRWGSESPRNSFPPYNNSAEASTFTLALLYRFLQCFGSIMLQQSLHIDCESKFDLAYTFFGVFF
jgi:hypothetical protein